MRCCRAFLVVAVAVGFVACTDAGDPAADGQAPTRTVLVSVSSEVGGQLGGAELVLVGQAAVPIDRSAAIEIDQPVAGLVRAEGYLDEPIVLDPGDGAVAVRMLRRVGATGVERRVLHVGGDVMLGRRYQEPGGREGTPTVDSPDSARRVVGDIGPIMAAADATMVNLETVVGELVPEAAYRGKRYQIQSPPVIVNTLDEMGVDFAALGNNHAYDWQEEGIRSTIDALDDAGIAWAGAGSSADEASAGRMISVLGTAVGVVSMTTVNGDFVNDSLPPADEPRPADGEVADAWQYVERTFGFGTPGDPTYVPVAARRAGEAWRAFAALEDDLTADDAAALWVALTGDGAYPELQDWVARRGHGGAAPLHEATVEREVAALRAEGAALVVVQIHGGFQFSEVPSDFMRRAARGAVDAGADLVVAHHPHVLQGFEWYDGSLIAYSLGNLVFDQDFLSTFPSAILRTVYEGDHLVEARVVPLTIDSYRPVPVAGEAAERVFRLMSARSSWPASSERIRPDFVGAVLDGGVRGDATVEREGTTGRVVPLPEVPGEAIEVGAAGQVDLPACALVRRVGEPVESAGVAIGTDLLGWGSLDDATADRANAPATHWVLGEHSAVRDDADHNGYLRLTPTAKVRAVARQVARSTVPEHRWFDSEGLPADGLPSYTVELTLRRDGSPPNIVVTLFDVHDTDPTVDPSSIEIHEEAVAVPRSGLGEWHTVSVDLTQVIQRRYGGVRAEALLLYVVSPSGGGTVDVDNVRLLEWRAASDLPAGAWVEADAVQAKAGIAAGLERRDCS